MRTRNFLPLLCALVVLLGHAVVCPGYLIPVEVGESATTPPLCIVYTESPPPGRYLTIHAALYGSGDLLWTDCYREFDNPPDYTELPDHIVEYTVHRAQLTPSEVAAFRNRILDRHTVEEYGDQSYRVDVHFAVSTALYVEGEEYFALRTSYDTGFQAGFGRLLAMQNPQMTPTPIPHRVRPFLDEWNFVTNALFELVDAQRGSDASSATMVFRPVFVLDTQAGFIRIGYSH